MTFAAGVLRREIAVSIHQDHVDEPDRETFTVTLAAAVNATLGDAMAIATILDDDLTAGVGADASTVMEGDVARFTVSLAGGPSTAPVAIGYRVAGTASAGIDYAMPAGSLTLIAGAATGTIAINTVVDDVLDPDETLQVLLHAASTLPGTVIVNPAKADATITIADAGMVTVAIGPPVLEVEEGRDAVLSVTLSGAVAEPVSLRYETMNESAEAVRDYSPTFGALTFAPGQVERTVTIPTLPDDVDEADESFALLLTAVDLPDGVNLGAVQATIVIADDDDPPVLSILDATVAEGEVAEFVVSLDPASERQVTAAYATGDGTAQAAEDYAAVSRTTLTFYAGDTARAISIATIQDTRNEDAEEFVVTLSNPSHATLVAGAATATATIIDDDAPPELSIAGASVSEGEVAEFVVILNPASGRRATVEYATGDGTARAGEDYAAVSRTTLTFYAGDTARAISVATIQDTRNEDAEEFVVTLSNPSHATLVAGAPAATGTITDDDPLPVLSVAGATVSEGVTAEFVVQLSPESGRSVTAAYRTSDGTARAGEDYTAVSRATLTFYGGDTTRTINIATIQDTRNEDEEAFAVTLSDPSNATLARDATTAIGTISDDDDNGGDDHGNTRSAATAIQPGSPVSGRLETATDVDYFKVAVNSSSTLVAATDAARAADSQHVEYGDTVVRIEGFGYFSSNTDSTDTAEITVGVPGSYDIFVRVSSARASRYDLAVWLTNPEVPDSSFDIALRFLGTEPTPGQKSTMRAAARVWERVITRGLTDRPVVSSEEACEDGDPSLFGDLIDDLLINVRLQAIDGPGGVLATAGPCWIRSTDGLPYLGEVLFDTADLAHLELHDALAGTVAHEFAHVLGFGLLWGDSLRAPSLGRSGNRIPGQDTHFTGREAVANFNAAGGATYAGAKVPVENDTAEYGIGALDAHWRESVFGAELMTTSVVVADPPEPLSAVTIASLADLGYAVDYSQAQSYLLPTGLSSRRAGPGAIRVIQLRDDIRRKPIRVGNPPEPPIPVVVP